MADRDVVLHTLEICSGYAGFSLGLKLAGVEHRTVAHIERDSHAAAVLVARMEDQALDQAPVWSDLVTFDGRAWCGRVDLVTAGFPCQPWSAAGQKRGLDDDRWLWPHIARIIAEVGPSLVFLENVPGLNRGPDGGGFSFVLQDLADLGFDAEWGLLSASAVGAPHKRERLWILATAMGDASGAGRCEIAGGASGDEGPDGRRSQGGDVAHGAGQDVGEPEGAGLQELGFAGQPELTGFAVPGDPDVADAESGGGDEGLGRPAWRWWVESQGDRFPPRPDDEGGWERWIAAGGPEPSLRRVPDGTSDRLVKPAGIADRLHLLGNGLVPLAAAHAFLALSERLLSDRSN